MFGSMNVLSQVIRVPMEDDDLPIICISAGTSFADEKLRTAYFNKDS